MFLWKNEGRDATAPPGQVVQECGRFHTIEFPYHRVSVGSEHYISHEVSSTHNPR